jgi:tetratricopeptide (TPR) repeat protein
MRKSCKYFMILLLAGFTTGALEPEPRPHPLDLEEYLDADDWFEAGLAMNNEGKYREAADAFAKSLSIHPDNPLSYLNLGTAQALSGDYDRSIESLKKSVRLNPSLALGFANLAEVCFRASRYQEAADAYSSLLTLWPDNANAHYKLGLAYLSLHDAGKAQAEYLVLKRVDPELASKLNDAINSAGSRSGAEK